MKKSERIILVFLFVVSLIYSFSVPETGTEKIENEMEITIYVEGAVNSTLVYDHEPDISDIFEDINVENIYGFDETYVLTSQDTLYIPIGENLISLNQASQEELMTIKGIGEKTSQKIIDQRPYYTIEDVMKVNGIGEKTYLKIREYLCL